jgi:hypothetical protein
VGERFNMTFGSQFINKHAADYGDSSKIIGNISMKF